MAFIHVIPACRQTQTGKVVLFDLTDHPIAYVSVMVDQSGFYQEVFG